MKSHTEPKTRAPSSRATATPVPNALAHQAQLRSSLLRAGVQPRLEIGAVNDPLERKADAAAERVIRMPAPLLTSPASQGRIAEPLLPSPARRRGAEGEGKLIQTKASPAPTATTASPQTESSLNSLNTGGKPLDPTTRTFFEPRFGQDFSQVRLHTNANAARMADSLGAQAFTLGNNIAFASNQYSTNTSAGKNLLGHELAHVVQQRSMNTGAPQAGLVQRTEEQEEPDTVDADAMVCQENVEPVIITISNRTIHYDDVDDENVCVGRRNGSVGGTFTVKSPATRQTLSGDTMENAYAGIRGQKDPIPAGEYDAYLRPASGNKPERIELMNVPGYQYIQIHPGNNVTDFQGCIGVGETDSYDNSTHTLNSRTRTVLENIIRIIRFDAEVSKHAPYFKVIVESTQEAQPPTCESMSSLLCPPEEQ